MFDKDKSGYIDGKEIILVTGTLGQALSAEELQAFMAEADLDGDGKLDYNEFVQMMTKSWILQNFHHIRFAFFTLYHQYWRKPITEFQWYEILVLLWKWNKYNYYQVKNYKANTFKFWWKYKNT